MADNYDSKVTNGVPPPSYGNATMRLLEAMGFGAKPKPPAPPAPNYNAIPLNPFSVPFTGLRNEPAPPPMPTQAGPLPPFQQPGADAQTYMPPRGLPSLSPPRQDNYGPGPSPAPQPAAMPSMPPVTVQAPAPASDNYADLGGYGGVPRMQSPQEMYGHLNPTPSLEEVFKREYAANPAAFGKLFG